jgi:hypothetical protein
MEPPQVTSIEHYSDFAHVTFSYEGNLVDALAPIVRAYSPRRTLEGNAGRIVCRISLTALGDTWVGDYVGEVPDREVYYNRKEKIYTQSAGRRKTEKMDIETKALNYIKDNPGCDSGHVITAIGERADKVMGALRSLQNKNLIERQAHAWEGGFGYFLTKNPEQPSVNPG